jgi:hypothetical protein
MRLITSFLTLTCGLALAQQGKIAGPISGYVFDPSVRALRAVVGVPGAATIGNPIDLGFSASGIWVSPLLDSAVAAGTDGSVHFLRLNAGALSEVSFSGAATAPQSVTFSPTGSAAALFSRSQAVIVTGLPNSPTVSGTIDLVADFARPSRLPALHRVATAVSDDGAYLLRASGGSVILYGVAGSHSVVGDGTDVAFAPSGHKAAMADLAGAGVVIFDDVVSANGRKVLAGPNASLQSSAGLSFSADGQKLFLVNLTSRSVVSFDLASSSQESITCRTAPQTLVRMGTTFRLNDLGTDPLWLLDTAPAEPQVVFVPALSAN